MVLGYEPSIYKGNESV